MSQQNDNNPFDPFGSWRTLRDANIDTWSKLMIETVNSEEYAKAMGAALDAYLTTSAPFREGMEKAMSQVLMMLNMPTRTDLISLAERLTNIEMRLDDLDAKIDALHSAPTSPTPTPKPEAKEEP